MSMVAGAARLRGARRASSRDRRPRTPRDLLGGVGRLALWLALAVLLLRGLADTFSQERTPTNRVSRGARGATWPDDSARAFAVQFATVYLDHADLKDAGAYTQALAAFSSRQLVDGPVPEPARQPAREAVRSAAVAGVTVVDRRRALITVAATVGGVELRVVRLAVPVARDAVGGLAVYDVPSLAPAPTLADAGPVEGDPLLGAERAGIEDVLRRFFGAFLAGDAGALAYFVPAGTRVGAVTGGFQLVQLGSVTAAGSPSVGGRVVLATVQARDRITHAVLALRYRVRVVRRDRWYVADINDTRTEGRAR